MFNAKVAESKNGHLVPVSNFANAQCKLSMTSPRTHSRH